MLGEKTLRKVNAVVRRECLPDFCTQIAFSLYVFGRNERLSISALPRKSRAALWNAICSLAQTRLRMSGVFFAKTVKNPLEPSTLEPRNSDRLNHAPDRSETVLLMIDVINHLEFDGGDKLLPHALAMAGALAAFKRRAKAHGIPAIYANDNFGRWRSNFPTLVEHFVKPDVRGSTVVAQLRPDEDDYFVLKPKHSAFYQTNLDILLRYLGVSSLILTGMQGDICVLFSANDAYMRDFRIIVPPDCTASETIERNQQALNLMQRVLKADTTTQSSELDLGMKITTNN
jgi:nicotinamidase-related amidase